MKKIISILLISLLFSFLFADEITDLFDKAKAQYNNNDTEAAIKSIDTIKGKLKNKENNNSSSETLEVSFNRVKVTPEKYNGKALKIRGVAISSSGFKKMNYYDKENEYGVSLFNITQNDFFPSYLDDGKMIFVMDENLVDQLLDIIPAGYSYYYNIWTEPVYEYSYYISSYSTIIHGCYIAKIIKLEAVEYNSYTNTIIDTGEFIGE